MGIKPICFLPRVLPWRGVRDLLVVITHEKCVGIDFSATLSWATPGRTSRGTGDAERHTQAVRTPQKKRKKKRKRKIARTRTLPATLRKRRRDPGCRKRRKSTRKSSRRSPVMSLAKTRTIPKQSPCLSLFAFL